MGWMHDTLEYLALDPIQRRYHQDQLTFRTMYAFTENFVLPLSHDEVVHGKGSLLGKMAGDEWQRFAHLRLLLAYQLGQPGKKLLFMGGEFGQEREWNHDHSLDWHLADTGRHAGVKQWVRDLNRLYREERALHELDCEPAGFEWVDCHDVENGVLSFLRRGKERELLVVFNFTPVPRDDYALGVPREGRWDEVLNSDATAYGGSGVGNLGGALAEPAPRHGRPFSMRLRVPPLGCLFLRPPRG
jgi:1,4-alpha-glucan branching enzyme